MGETLSTLGLPRAQLRIWVYRIPSLIGAIGAVLLTYWTALAFVTRRGAVFAALLMCCSVLLGAEARLAKTDAMLLLTVVAAMGALARIYLSWQRGEDPGIVQPAHQLGAGGQRRAERALRERPLAARDRPAGP